MSELGLRHCSVLVVGDSAPARTLVATTLHEIGVGVVNTVPHGAAAIAHLKHSQLSSINGPTPPVDLIVSEWDMQPVSGSMLTNWVRRSAQSPDRFTRTVIMSGALDVEKVEDARAVGVNAVFAKPFTVASLERHVTTLLNANPAFFKTPSYFGPDRRRRASGVVLEQRRKIAHSHHEVLGGGEDVNVGCFDQPHYLKKVLAGEKRPLIDYSQRFAAHQTLAPFSEDYADWIKSDVNVLRLALRIANELPDMRARNLAVMHAIAMRLEREGAHLGYPLAAAFAHTLKNILEADQRLWRSTVGICNTAVHGLEAVVRGRVSGEGGATGIALHQSLAEMNGKLSMLRPKRTHRQGVTF